ncbi:MAG: hypothetical protein MRY21_08595 [Simkaniaceae bacterium]|nr:hypothetical protein [Simkaniaceae bacterium]
MEATDCRCRERPRRVTVLGLLGSGKSHFSRKLGDKLGLPVYHLDKYYFHANWIKRDREEFRAILDEIVAKESWIIDGNCMHSLHGRQERSDVTYYFRLPRLISIWHIFKRAWIHIGRKRECRPEGCSEAVSWSLIAYTWNFDKRFRERIYSSKCKVIEVNSRVDLESLF